jgi:hypothetical protein
MRRTVAVKIPDVPVPGEIITTHVESHKGFSERLTFQAVVCGNYLRLEKAL